MVSAITTIGLEVGNYSTVHLMRYYLRENLIFRFASVGPMKAGQGLGMEEVEKS